MARNKIITVRVKCRGLPDNDDPMPPPPEGLEKPTPAEFSSDARPRLQAIEPHGDVLVENFDGRPLPCDAQVATACATIFAARRPASTHDPMIGAVARSHGARMVTQDISGFQGGWLTFINPWFVP